MKRVLLADGMAIVREPLEVLLRDRGYEVIVAADGDQAWRRIRQDHPDVVVLDLALAKMNGLAVMAAMRREPALRSIAVVVLTAVTDKQAVREAGKLGARAYLLKNRFSLAELYERIDSAVAGPVEAPAGRADSPSLASEPKPTAGHASTPAAPTGGAPGIEPVASASANETEVLKSLRPIVTRSQMDEQIEKAGALKAMSPTVRQLIKMTDSSRYSIDQVARVVKQDQAISLKVLQMANSVVYSRGEPAESVLTAVMRIGLKQIREVVKNISVIDQFSRSLDGSLLNIYSFWEHAIATGLIAANVTRLRNGREGEVESAFTMGLLHDVGRMVLVDQMGQIYEQVLERADRLQLPLERVESRMLLINHADLMDRVLHQWNFAKTLINPIALHHLSLSNLRSIAPKTIMPDATLALANRMAHALLLGCSGNQTIYPIAEFVEMLKITNEQFTQLEQQIPDQTHDLKYVMLQTASQTAWPSEVQRWRKALAVPFRPIFLGTDPAIDAYRIVCDRLRDSGGGEADEPSANLAVVHFRGVRQRDELAERLKQTGPEHLPVLMISPKGNILFDERTLKGRPYLTLASPTHMGRFVFAVNRLLGGAEPDRSAEVAAEAMAVEPE